MQDASSPTEPEESGASASEAANDKLEGALAAREGGGDDDAAAAERAVVGDKASVAESPVADHEAPLAGSGATGNQQRPASQGPNATPAPRGAAWGEPIARFERQWTWLETRLITGVLLAQIFSLVAWVLLAGLAAPVGADSSSGTVFRAVVGASALAAAAWLGSKRLRLSARRGLVFAAIALGIVAAPLWRARGVEYFDNLRGWLQEGSTLTLMGGLRGLATRLTLWLALLGASLATSAGKHIHVDLLFRLLPVRLRLPAAILNYSAAALVCFAGAWGFFDHIAIESFGSRADDAAGAKIVRSAHQVSDHLFLTRKQLGLDLRSLPHVLRGDRYDSWMSAPAWNAWVRDAGFEGRYPAEGMGDLLVPNDGPPHVPLVLSPDGETARGILVHDLSLVFPFGLLVIGIRFLLRALLSLSGHLSVDPDEAHKEELKRASEAVGGA